MDREKKKETKKEWRERGKRKTVERARGRQQE